MAANDSYVLSRDSLASLRCATSPFSFYPDSLIRFIFSVLPFPLKTMFPPLARTNVALPSHLFSFLNIGSMHNTTSAMPTHHTYSIPRSCSRQLRLSRGHLLKLPTWAVGQGVCPSAPFHFRSFPASSSSRFRSIWLISLADSLRNTDIKLTGFDISSAQFPSREWLPNNIELKLLDITKKEDFPTELRGRFDVVHVGLLVMAVRDNDPGPIIEGLMTLLSGLSFSSVSG